MSRPGGRVCDAPSCGVGGAAIESFQGVNLLTKRPALIPIEKNLTPEHKPGSCKLLLSKDRVKTQTLIELKPSSLKEGKTSFY